MNRAFFVFRCDGCGASAYPRRLLCASCGGSSSCPVEASSGVVEEATVRTHRTYEAKRDLVGGWEEREAVPLVSIRTDAGPVVVARAVPGLRRGDRVALAISSGAPVAALANGPEDDIVDQIQHRKSDSP